METMEEEDKPPEASGVAQSRMMLAVAGMENRLREQINDLINPTKQKMQVQEGEMHFLRDQVVQHTTQIQSFNSVQNKLHENKMVVDVIREEMQKMDAKVHSSITRQHEENRQLGLVVETLQKNVELKESAMNHMQRSLERSGLELTRLQDQMEQFGPAYIDGRLDESRRTALKSIAELEAKLINMQMEHARLTDQLWGEEAGLAKVSGEVVKINKLVENIRSSVSALQESAVAPQDLMVVREDVASWLGKAETDMSSLRCTVGNVVDETKEHLRTGLQTVALQTAHFVGEVRNAYTEEIKSSKFLRDEVEDFVKATREQLASIDERVSSAMSNTEQMVQDNLELIQRNYLQSKRRESAYDLEIKSVHKRLTHMSDSLDRILKGIDHLWGVTGMVLEATSMQCELDIQDTADRDSVSLLGMQEKEAAPDSMMTTGSMSSPRKPPMASPGRKKLGKQVVSVDERCLACSGQATTVLKAFKVACLQYSPSPVVYSGQEYKRTDLLRTLSDLVGSAQNKYLSDPAGKQNSVMDSFDETQNTKRMSSTMPAGGIPLPAEPGGSGRSIPTPREPAPMNRRSVSISVDREPSVRRGGKLPQLGASP